MKLIIPSLLLLVHHCSNVDGVVSPLDNVSAEIRILKETVNSVQASLITSVSLIQGKARKILLREAISQI